MKRTLTLLGILAMFFSLTAFFGGKMTKFKWATEASAPEQFPMRIIAANLIYGEGDAAYVPGGVSIAPGWGSAAASAGAHDPRPIPRVLDILFFSYTEDAFYRGKFVLPYNKMLAAFQAGYDFNLGGNRQREVFGAITVGVAPGGVVAIWLQGPGKSLEVFYDDRATKVTLPWSIMTDNTRLTREEYVADTIKHYVKSPEAYAALKKTARP